jgi:hypothetical protein
VLSTSFFLFCDEPGSFINLNHHSPLQAANGDHFKRSAKKNWEIIFERLGATLEGNISYASDILIASIYYTVSLRLFALARLRKHMFVFYAESVTHVWDEQYGPLRLRCRSTSSSARALVSPYDCIALL